MFEQIDAMVSAFEVGKLTRRDLVARLGVFAAAMAGVGQVDAAEEESSPTFDAKGLNHIALSVTNVSRSRDWYVKHLGLRVSRDGSPCFLTCGDNFLALFPSKKAGMHHYAYTIDNYDPSRAVKTLKAAGLEPERHENRVYFPDPDGLTVQVSPRNR